MNENEARVTTIIPSYNHASYVSEAIESVLKQEYGNHELIVVDDGSKDGSAEVIARYRDHPLVTVILNERNRGQSAVMRQGLEVASGEFIALLPSDDWIVPQRNRLQTGVFAKAGPDTGIVYGRGKRYIDSTGAYEDADLPLRRGDLFEYLMLSGNVIFPVTPLIRAVCYRQFPPDPTLAAEGEALWVKMASAWKFDYVDAVVGIMRQHGRNSGRNWRLTYSQNIDYWERWFDDPSTPARAHRLRDKALARMHRMYGLTFLRDANDPQMARKALWASVRERPLQLLNDWKLAAGLVMAIAGKGRLHPCELQRPAQE